jgi:hypothetical protein
MGWLSNFSQLGLYGVRRESRDAAFGAPTWLPFNSGGDYDPYLANDTALYFVSSRDSTPDATVAHLYMSPRLLGSNNYGSPILQAIDAGDDNELGTPLVDEQESILLFSHTSNDGSMARVYVACRADGGWVSHQELKLVSGNPQYVLPTWLSRSGRVLYFEVHDGSNPTVFYRVELH